jgi:hypothetical protein
MIVSHPETAESDGYIRDQLYTSTGHWSKVRELSVELASGKMLASNVAASGMSSPCPRCKSITRLNSQPFLQAIQEVERYLIGNTLGIDNAIVGFAALCSMLVDPTNSAQSLVDDKPKPVHPPAFEGRQMHLLYQHRLSLTISMKQQKRTILIGRDSGKGGWRP